MANQHSNFRRQPASRPLTGHCHEHEGFESAEVEQFDGSVLIRTCQFCRWAALNKAPLDSEERNTATAQVKAERLNTALVGSGITPRFLGSSFDNYRVDDNPMAAKALEICQAYVNQFEENYRLGRSLILAGKVGCGKTHLASSIVQGVIRSHSAQALIVSVAEIIRVSKGVMVKGATYTDTDVIRELAEVDLLVIDEVGAQKGSDYELGVLHEVLDRRYQLVRPTVVVSNLLVTELPTFLGLRALDRLRQNGGLLAGFTWESARATV
jgi:DNA replication protein DnaC